MKIPNSFIPKKNLEDEINRLISKDETPKREGYKGNEYYQSLWRKQAANSKDGKKNLVAISYLYHVLGLTNDAVLRFDSGNVDNEIYELVAELQNCSNSRRNDFESFWYDVKKIFPNTYSDEELEFLINRQEISVFTMLHYFETLNPTILLTRLRLNAMHYNGGKVFS